VTVRTTSHTRVGGRAEVSVGGKVEVRRALVRIGDRIANFAPRIQHVGRPSAETC